jgi:hypothetical protein
MNKVHSSLLRYIRDALKAEDNTVIGKMIDGKTDEQIVRMMFSNIRGRDSHMRGLRLTNFGVTVMRSYFQAYEIEREGKKLGPMELVYLDKKARLPYWLDDHGNVVMFDPDLGIKLKLADGDISVLMEMDATLAG